jgi:hypothetical protein
MKSKVLYLLVLFITISTAQYSIASDIEKRTAANELFDLMNMDVLLNESIEKMLQLEIQNNSQLGLYEDVVRTFFKKHMSGESLRDEFVDIYNQAFTEKELIDIVNFYKTSTGQKALRQTPALVQKFMIIGQKRVQDNLPELKQMITDETERLQKLKNSSNK